MTTPNSNPANPNPVRVLQSGLLVALCSALAISGWSLFWVGRHYGLPVPIAALVSAGFDGAAVSAAGYSIRYAVNGLSVWFPRVVVLSEAVASMFLNSQHAALQHLPHAASVLYAVPPLTVVALLEIHLHMLLGLFRKANPVRNSKNNSNSALIKLRSIGTTRTPPGVRGSKRVGQVSSRESKEVVGGASSGAGSGGAGVSSRANAGASSDASPKAMRAWAASQGMNMPRTGPVPIDVRQQYLAAHNGGSHE